MNKVELIREVSKETGFSQKDITEVTETILNVIVANIKNGDEVNFAGFGKFYAQNRDARKGINPRTMESIEIGATRSPKFKAGSWFKSEVAI